ncbi:MAG: NAD/NADP octopine/nopaline dehydrogenase family protein [Spirochaetia bacterium]|nr:NAD/NADP octopine/nopaline dehydrogenase family protein [Spirochaetia bacterium]
MKITIVGGGNIGTQFAIHCAEKGHDVVIFTSKPEKFSKKLEEIDENGNISHAGYISCATNDEKKAFSNAEIIFVTLPAFMMEGIAKVIEKYAHQGLMIYLIPGTGGGECAFRTSIEKGAVVFGLQRVPSVARLVEYGKKVHTAGYRDYLYIASIPCLEVNKGVDLIKSLFGKQVLPLENYLCVTMTPSNPILHTSRLKSIFDAYKKGMTYDRVPLFYEEWDNKTSELLLKCDSEVQTICKALPMFNLSAVKSLREHYEGDTVDKITNKIRSIKSLKGLKTPAVKLENGFIPDFSSRYFTADFPYGLAILVQIAEMTGVDVPNCKLTLEWYWQFGDKNNMFKFSDYGINTFEDFESFYSR